MKQFRKTATATALLLAGINTACAATDVFFNPLTQSAAVAQVPNHVNELNSPWQVPAGVSYRNLTNLHKIETAGGQSSVRVPGLGSNASMTDMSAFDPTGRFIFLPHETQCGAGLTRYDMKTDEAINLFHGDEAGCNVSPDWSEDFGALDPATWTPVDTLLVAEEWSGQGRMFEVMNPMADVAGGETMEVNELNSIPNVSHEGLRFNHAGTALYFVDEDHSGSIYKFVPSIKGDYTQGQTFVLSVDAFDGDPSAAGKDQPNRTGLAHWVAMTDANGNALTINDPFINEFTNTYLDAGGNEISFGVDSHGNPILKRHGRIAADEIGGTPYDRPEDVEVGYVKNGNEVLYFNATTAHRVFSVEELGNGEAMVRLAADPNTPKNLGYAGTTGSISSPDNLAQDALGNIYVVEDKPNGDNIGGDVWFLRDTDSDGVAESLDHFMSLQVKGAENTGMIFRPGHPTQFIINVQHPESTADEINSQGDSTWLIDLKDVVAPPCVKEEHGHHHHHHKVKTCSDSDDVNFIKKLIKAGK